MKQAPATFHLTVNQTPVTTHETTLTGSQIKALAGVDPTDLLELREGSKRVPITDGEEVQIRNGLHFVTYPGGTDS